MNPFLRLLFVCAVLFIVLGQHEKQWGDPCTPQPFEGAAVDLVSPVGILPALSWNTEAHIVPGLFSLPQKNWNNQEQRRNQASIFTLVQLQNLAFRYMEIKPDITGRTGQYLHLSADKEDPSLI